MQIVLSSEFFILMGNPIVNLTVTLEIKIAFLI